MDMLKERYRYLLERRPEPSSQNEE
jgi:hypothetical protein